MPLTYARDSWAGPMVMRQMLKEINDGAIIPDASLRVGPGSNDAMGGALLKARRKRGRSGRRQSQAARRGKRMKCHLGIFQDSARFFCQNRRIHRGNPPPSLPPTMNARSAGAGGGGAAAGQFLEIRLYYETRAPSTPSQKNPPWIMSSRGAILGHPPRSSKISLRTQFFQLKINVSDGPPRDGKLELPNDHVGSSPRQPSKMSFRTHEIPIKIGPSHVRFRTNNISKSNLRDDYLPPSMSF